MRHDMTLPICQYLWTAVPARLHGAVVKKASRLIPWTCPDQQSNIAIIVSLGISSIAPHHAPSNSYRVARITLCAMGILEYDIDMTKFRTEISEADNLAPKWIP